MFVLYVGDDVSKNILQLLSIKKNLVYNFLLSASQVLLPLISIPYISRVLDPSGIGKVSFIDSFTYYFISIAEFGIVVYGMREVAKLKDNTAERSKLVSELMVLHIISSCIALIFYLVSVFFVWSKIQDVRLLLFSLSFLLVNFFACEWYFLGMEKFRYITFRSVITRLLGLISIFLLIKSPDDYYIYYAIIVISAIANSIWNNIQLFKELPLKFTGVNWRKHIGKTRITWFISLAYGITLMLDNVFLRLVSTDFAVGFYAFAMKIVRISSTMLTDTLLVFFPRIVSLYNENNRNEMYAVILKNLQLIILFSIPLCAGIFLLAEPLIVIFLGDQFTPSIENLRILAVYPFLRTYNLFLSKQVLITHHKEHLYLKSLLTGSCLFVLLTLVLSYYYAGKGACYAIVVSEIIMLLMNYHYVKKTDNNLKAFDWLSLLHAVIGAAIFVPIIYFFNSMYNSQLLVLVFSITACFVFYILMQVYVIKNGFMLFTRDAVFRFVQKSIGKT